MGDPTTIALNLTFFGTLVVALVMFFGLFLVFVATLVIAGLGRLAAVTIMAVGRGLFRTAGRTDRTAATARDRPVRTIGATPQVQPHKTAKTAKATAGPMVADAVRKTNRMLDPSESGGKGSDPRPRCGRSACHGRNTRQPVGIKWCGFCALPMSGREPSDSVERPVSLRLVADA